MANNKRRKKRKGGGRKLEFAIYIAGVLLVCLVVFGIVKGVQALKGPQTATDASSVTTQPASLPASQPESSSQPASDASTGSQAPSSQASSQEASSQATSSQAVSSQAVSSQAVSSQAVSSQATSSQAAQPANGKVNGDYIQYTKSGADELNEWYLFLLNPTHTVDSSWSVPMTYLDEEYRLDSRIITAYKDMVKAAANDGVWLYPVSCYRSYETQNRLYWNRVERAKRDNPSFSQKEAEDYAATIVARPGTSEHQSGLAIDFNSLEQDFGSTKAGKWLYTHCNDYGFILRYEKEKQSLTGVIWEPWHFRFVGVKHAKRMTELGYCLEEYIDYIKAGGQ